MNRFWPPILASGMVLFDVLAFVAVQSLSGADRPQAIFGSTLLNLGMAVIFLLRSGYRPANYAAAFATVTSVMKLLVLGLVTIDLGILPIVVRGDLQVLINLMILFDLLAFFLALRRARQLGYEDGWDGPYRDRYGDTPPPKRPVRPVTEEAFVASSSPPEREETNGGTDTPRPSDDPEIRDLWTARGP